MPTYMITGANRGLGLEFVTQLASNGSNTIICATRSLSSDISALESLRNGPSKIHIFQCDTSDLKSISSFANQVIATLGSTSRIDFLINNAGINSVPHQTSLTLTSEGLSAQMTTNVLGPAKIVQELLSLLHRGSIVMNMTSGLGSLEYSRSKDANDATAYSISKAGLNMLTVHQSLDLREKGVVVICMDPGWVKTSMGGEKAPLEKEESISGMLECLNGLTTQDSGKFFTYTGKEKPW